MGHVESILGVDEINIAAITPALVTSAFPFLSLNFPGNYLVLVSSIF